MAVYTSEASLRPTPEALPDTGGLRLLPEIEHYDLQRIMTETGQEAWSVRIINDDGNEWLIPAEPGTLIRDFDENTKRSGHTFINAGGERRWIDPRQRTYPIEVAARLSRVNNLRQEQGLPAEDPLGLQWPEALRQFAPPVPDRPHGYESQHKAESRYKTFFRNLGKKIGGLLVQPMLTEEAPDTLRDEIAFAPAQTKPNPQPRPAPHRVPATSSKNSARAPSSNITRAFGHRRPAEAPAPAAPTPTTAEVPFRVNPKTVEIGPYHEPDFSAQKGAAIGLLNKALAPFGTDLKTAKRQGDVAALAYAYQSVEAELQSAAARGSANAPKLLVRLERLAERLQPLTGDRHIRDIPVVIDAPR